jgi:hypothetical protein
LNIRLHCSKGIRLVLVDAIRGTSRRRRDISGHVSREFGWHHSWRETRRASGIDSWQLCRVVSRVTSGLGRWQVRRWESRHLSREISRHIRRVGCGAIRRICRGFQR